MVRNSLHHSIVDRARQTQRRSACALPQLRSRPLPCEVLGCGALGDARDLVDATFVRKHDGHFECVRVIAGAVRGLRRVVAVQPGNRAGGDERQQQPILQQALTVLALRGTFA